MVEKINTLCDQIYEDIQNLRKSGNYDVEKRKMIEAELKALGINTIDELNEAIKKEKLDVTLMVAPIPNKKAATC